MSEEQEETLARETWEKAYPDRRPWDQIGEAQAEWKRVFRIWEEKKKEAGL